MRRAQDSKSVKCAAMIRPDEDDNDWSSWEAVQKFTTTFRNSAPNAVSLTTNKKKNDKGEVQRGNSGIEKITAKRPVATSHRGDDSDEDEDEDDWSSWDAVQKFTTTFRNSAPNTVSTTTTKNNNDRIQSEALTEQFIAKHNSEPVRGRGQMLQKLAMNDMGFMDYCINRELKQANINMQDPGIEDIRAAARAFGANIKFDPDEPCFDRLLPSMAPESQEQFHDAEEPSFSPIKTDPPGTRGSPDFSYPQENNINMRDTDVGVFGAAASSSVKLNPDAPCFEGLLPTMMMKSPDQFEDASAEPIKTVPSSVGRTPDFDDPQAKNINMRDPHVCGSRAATSCTVKLDPDAPCFEGLLPTMMMKSPDQFEDVSAEPIKTDPAPSTGRTPDSDDPQVPAKTSSDPPKKNKPFDIDYRKHGTRFYNFKTFGTTSPAPTTSGAKASRDSDPARPSDDVDDLPQQSSVIKSSPRLTDTVCLKQFYDTYYPVKQNVRAISQSTENPQAADSSNPEAADVNGVEPVRRDGAKVHVDSNSESSADVHVDTTVPYCSAVNGSQPFSQSAVETFYTIDESSYVKVDPALLGRDSDVQTPSPCCPALPPITEGITTFKTDARKMQELNGSLPAPVELQLVPDVQNIECLSDFALSFEEHGDVSFRLLNLVIAWMEKTIDYSQMKEQLTKTFSEYLPDHLEALVNFTRDLEFAQEMITSDTQEMKQQNGSCSDAAGPPLTPDIPAKPQLTPGMPAEHHQTPGISPERQLTPDVPAEPQLVPETLTPNISAESQLTPEIPASPQLTADISAEPELSPEVTLDLRITSDIACHLAPITPDKQNIDDLLNFFFSLDYPQLDGQSALDRLLDVLIAWRGNKIDYSQVKEKLNQVFSEFFPDLLDELVDFIEDFEFLHWGITSERNTGEMNQLNGDDPALDDSRLTPEMPPGFRFAPELYLEARHALEMQVEPQLAPEIPVEPQHTPDIPAGPQLAPEIPVEPQLASGVCADPQPLPNKQNMDRLCRFLLRFDYPPLEHERVYPLVRFLDVVIAWGKETIDYSQMKGKLTQMFSELFPDLLEEFINFTNDFGLSHTEIIAPEADASMRYIKQQLNGDDVSMEPQHTSDIPVEPQHTSDIPAEPQLAPDMPAEPELTTDISVEPQLPPDVPAKLQLAPEIPAEPQLAPDLPAEPELTTDISGEPQLPPDVPAKLQLAPDVPAEPQLAPDMPAEPELTTDISVEPQLPPDGPAKLQLAPDIPAEPQLAPDSSVESQLAYIKCMNEQLNGNYLVPMARSTPYLAVWKLWSANQSSNCGYPLETQQAPGILDEPQHTPDIPAEPQLAPGIPIEPQRTSDIPAEPQHPPDTHADPQLAPGMPAEPHLPASPGTTVTPQLAYLIYLKQQLNGNYLVPLESQHSADIPAKPLLAPDMSADPQLAPDIPEEPKHTPDVPVELQLHIPNEHLKIPHSVDPSGRQTLPHLKPRRECRNVVVLNVLNKKEQEQKRRDENGRDGNARDSL